MNLYKHAFFIIKIVKKQRAEILIEQKIWLMGVAKNKEMILVVNIAKTVWELCKSNVFKMTF